MKRLLLALLAGSALLNLALGVVLLWGNVNSPSAPAPRPAAPVAAAAAPAPKIDANVWPSLRTDELPVLVARLREAGFPPAMVRAILLAQLAETSAARRKALEPDAEKQAFWKRPASNPAVEAAMRQLAREQTKLLRELLGDDADSGDPVGRAYEERRVAGVPAAKLADVRAILRDYDLRRSELYGGGPMLPADREKVIALERQQREAIARVLTPQELLEYDLRSSNTASSLRSSLAAFEPTEYEFRTIFALQKEFDDRAPNGGQLAQTELRARAEAQDRLNEQIKAALGPARGADFERTTNWEYRQTSQLVARLQLPPETTNRLWEVQRDFRERTNDILGTRDQTPEVRDQRLAQLRVEANAQLTPLLGDARRIEAYRMNGGYWLDQLAPRGAPSPTR